MTTPSTIPTPSPRWKAQLCDPDLQVIYPDSGQGQSRCSRCVPPFPPVVPEDRASRAEMEAPRPALAAIRISRGDCPHNSSGASTGAADAQPQDGWRGEGERRVRAQEVCRDPVGRGRERNRLSRDARLGGRSHGIGGPRGKAVYPERPGRSAVADCLSPAAGPCAPPGSGAGEAQGPEYRKPEAWRRASSTRIRDAPPPARRRTCRVREEEAAPRRAAFSPVPRRLDRPGRVPVPGSAEESSDGSLSLRWIRRPPIGRGDRSNGSG